MTDRIEKTIDLKAPVEKVWRALTDHTQFGQWFLVNLDDPFVPGQVTRGRIAYPGYEHLTWESQTVRMDEPTYFSMTWHPYAVEPGVDYSAEPQTLIEFKLERLGEGTRLTVVESGFDKLPPERRDIAFRSNEGGWEEQLQNIRRYVER